MFVFYFIVPLIIFCFSLWGSFYWVQDLYAAYGTWLVALVPVLISLLPSLFSLFLLMGLKRRVPPPVCEDVPVAILVPAHNESVSLYRTLESLANVEYDKNKVRIVVVLDRCTDDTEDWAKRFSEERPGVSLDILKTHLSSGKAHALNVGLGQVSEEIIIAIDADVVVHPKALRLLVRRLLESDENVAGAGNIQIGALENSTLWERAQVWDYRIGIFYTKMAQDRLGALSVAHGSCAIYRTKHLRELGWSESSIGEDIVLTYQLAENINNRIVYEPRALFFTSAPSTLKMLLHQRKRWARGWWENLETNKGVLFRKRASTLFACVSTLLPLVDLGFIVITLPALVFFILTLQGNNFFSWISLLVLPISLYNFFLINHEFERYTKGADLEKGSVGALFFYLTLYSLINMCAGLVAIWEHFITKKDKEW